MTMDPMEQMLELGYSVWPQRIDEKIIYDLAYYKESYDHPNRGHDRNGVYYAEYHESVEWANYWTDPLSDNIRIGDIREVTDRLVARFLVEPVFYHADVSVLTPLNSMIRPHVDTPYRHAPWNQKITHGLGVQIGIPMQSYTENAGTTAFLPGSHKRAWDIKKCYRGEYTDVFLSECVQPKIEFGDILLWDARTLHSQMPNVSRHNRYMLLLNYLERHVVEDVMQYEAAQQGVHT
jgi:hypothetical protein